LNGGQFDIGFYRLVAFFGYTIYAIVKLLVSNVDRIDK
jgi:hypothetical protein